LRPNYAIAISGYVTKAARTKKRAIRFSHHIVKPVFPDSLGTLLKEGTAELAEKSKRFHVDINHRLMTPTLARRRFHLSMTPAPQLRAPGAYS
jgi:hypothetical protein